MDVMSKCYFIKIVESWFHVDGITKPWCEMHASHMTHDWQHDPADCLEPQPDPGSTLEHLVITAAKASLCDFCLD